MSRLQDFDPYIEQAMQSWHCPGVALALVERDEVLHQGAYGWRDVEGQLPMTPDSRFAMASVTKSFTAMSVALLVDEGRMAWDEPVREYMPEFVLDDAYVSHHVTVRDMLSHRTGLPRHDLSAWRLDSTRAEFIERMRHFKFSATFREKFQYNNLMYYATAYLVEKVAGQRWEDFVHERIFAPLGMGASNFVPEPPGPDQVNTKGYRVDRDEEGGAKGLIHMPFGRHSELSPGAAGALFSTLADLVQWLKVHINQGRAGSVQLVAPENLQQMHLPQMVVPGGGVSEALHGNTIFTYGMGWFIEPYRGHTLIRHGGNVEGFSLMVGFVPQAQLGVVALTNIGMLPLRDVLLCESIDRALGLERRDWNDKYHQVVDPQILAEARAVQTAAQERIDEAPPTHPLESYAGSYQAEGYPDFSVRCVEGRLQACIVGIFDWSQLRPYHYDIFEWHLVDIDHWVKIQFLVDTNGEVGSISIPLEGEVDDILFKRCPPELSQELVEALIGRYDTPVEGLGFAVTSRLDKVYITQTGGPPQEVKAYKLTDEWIGFTMGRARLDFARQEGEIRRLLFKGPATTLEAVRSDSQVYGSFD